MRESITGVSRKEADEFLAARVGQHFRLVVYRSYRWFILLTYYDVVIELINNPEPKPPVANKLAIRFGRSFDIGDSAMSGTLFPAQRVAVVLNGFYEKSDGTKVPAPVEGVSFVSSNEALVTIEEDGDGDDKTVYAVSTSNLEYGDVQITATADPVIGEGVGEPLVAIGTLSVIARQATGVGLGFGVPEDLPVA